MILSIIATTPKAADNLTLHYIDIKTAIKSGLCTGSCLLCADPVTIMPMVVMYAPKDSLLREILASNAKQYRILRALGAWKFIKTPQKIKKYIAAKRITSDAPETVGKN